MVVLSGRFTLCKRPKCRVDGMETILPVNGGVGESRWRAAAAAAAFGVDGEYNSVPIEHGAALYVLHPKVINHFQCTEPNTNKHTLGWSANTLGARSPGW